MTEYSPPDRGLSPNDRAIMTKKGWFPKTDFPVLEDLRERHEALVDQRAVKQAESIALTEAFEAEDEARQAALDRAYREAGEPDLPIMTSPEDRKAKLAEADAHALAAARAVVAFAYGALDRLRGGESLPPGWNPWQAAQMHRVPPGGVAEKMMATISIEESELRQQITEAQRLMESAGLRLREFAPLKMWIVRNGNAGNGQMEPGADLPVPPTHSPMTKPRDLHVPGWWPEDPDGVDAEFPITGIVPEGHEHLIPDDAEEGVVEMSDSWHLEQERKARQEA